MPESTVDNTKNNRALAVVMIVALIGMNIMAKVFGYWPEWWAQALAIALTLAFAYMNFKAKPNVDNWVGWLGWITVIVTVFTYVIPISKHSV